MQAHELRLRMASPEDGAACAAVYAPYVEETAISFEYAPPTAVEMNARIASTLETHPWIVALGAEHDVIGYAYATHFRGRAAYAWSAEVSVYVARNAHRRGVGRRLYHSLLAMLREMGFTQAIAGATMPNAASRGLHEALGFREIARFPRIGRKQEAWWDVVFWQLDLCATPWGLRPKPQTLSQVRDAAWLAKLLG